MQQYLAVVWKGDTFPNNAVIRRFREILTPLGYRMHDNITSIREIAKKLRGTNAPAKHPNVVLYCVDRQEVELIEFELRTLRAIDPQVLFLLLGGNFAPKRGLDLIEIPGVRDYFAPVSSRQIRERITHAVNPDHVYVSDDFGELHPNSKVFVAAPNRLKSFWDTADAALERLLLKPIHADTILVPGRISDKVVRLIQEAELVLACVTPEPSSGSYNANVCVEVGVALAQNRLLLPCISHPVVTEPPALILDLDRIEYDDDIDLAVQIYRKIGVK